MHVLPDPHILRILNIQNPANESLLGNVVWAISNLCRGKPQPALPIVGRFIPDLCGLLHTNCSDDAKVDALWALSYITDGDNARIEAVVGQGITPKLVEILQGGAIRFTSPALRTLGNFATGTEAQTQAVIDAGVLEIAAELLDHSKVRLVNPTPFVSYLMISNPETHRRAFEKSPAGS